MFFGFNQAMTEHTPIPVMKEVTDKYHRDRIRKGEEKHLNPHFDIKDVSKRTYQLGLATMFTGVALAIYTAFIGLYGSSFVSACFCWAILLVILLKYHGDISNRARVSASVVTGI